MTDLEARSQDERVPLFHSIEMSPLWPMRDCTREY